MESSAIRWPSEDEPYRVRREELLREEAALRRQLERVAALRRSLPPGGRVREDYAFEEGPADLTETGTVRRVRLSQLFRRPQASLVVYGFMYGPEMERPCPMCTSMLDGLDAQAPHIMQRVNLVVLAKSPIERIRSFARDRGWRRLRLLSSAANSYNRDYFGEGPHGDQWPMLNVFEQRDGQLRHFYGTELLCAPTDAGQDPRHVDLIWPLWNLLDFTREGRGTDWYPALSYDS